MDTQIQQQRLYLVLHYANGLPDIERVEVGERLRDVLLYHLFPDRRYHARLPRVRYITFKHDDRRYGVKRGEGRNYLIVELPPEVSTDEGLVEI
jgi:hypothetical protein